MATVQTDGSSAVTKASTVNNGGTAVNVGTTSTVLSNQSLGRDDQGVFGSKVVSNAVVDYADPALSGGTFAYNNTTPIAPRLTTTLAGISNTFLRSGASDLSSRRSIHRQEKVRSNRFTTAFRNGNFNLYTGQYSSVTTAVDNFWDIANDTTSATSTDNAATPTRSSPGELTYKLGQPSPVSTTYSAKNT